MPKALRKLLILSAYNDIESHGTNEIAIILHFITSMSTSFEVASKKLQNKGTTVAEIYEVVIKLIK